MKRKLILIRNYILNFFKILYLIFIKTTRRFLSNHGFIIANGLSFKTIVALVPALIIIVGALKVFPIFLKIRQNLVNFIIDFVLPFAKGNFNHDMISNEINNMIDKSGAVSIVGLFVFIYLILNLLITLDNQVQRIWSTNIKLPIMQKILKYWAFLSAAPFIVGFYFYYSGLIRTIKLPVAPVNNLLELLYSLVTFFVMNIIIFLSYFIIPNSRVNPLKAVTVSVFISVIWMILRIIFNFYSIILKNNWDIIYGSFVIILVFIFWTNINWIVFLYGLEFLFVWQNKYYTQEYKIKDIFLTDIAIIILIFKEFHIDFTSKGQGIKINELSKKIKYGYEELISLFKILEMENIIINDKNNPDYYYLKKDVSVLKLTDIENFINKKLVSVNINIKEFQKIIKKLRNVYFRHKDDTKLLVKDFF